MIKRGDEALALLRSRIAPMRAEHEPGCVFGVKMRQQVLLDERVDLRRILAERGAVRIQLLQHGARDALEHLRWIG
jgi:hypothetical protein